MEKTVFLFHKLYPVAIFILLLPLPNNLFFRVPPESICFNSHKRAEWQKRYFVAKAKPQKNPFVFLVFFSFSAAHLNLRWFPLNLKIKQTISPATTSQRENCNFVAFFLFLRPCRRQFFTLVSQMWVSCPWKKASWEITIAFSLPFSSISLTTRRLFQWLIKLLWFLFFHNCTLIKLFVSLTKQPHVDYHFLSKAIFPYVSNFQRCCERRKLKCVFHNFMRWWGFYTASNFDRLPSKFFYCFGLVVKTSTMDI